MVAEPDDTFVGTVNEIPGHVGADGKAIKETIPVNGGQWGLTQDDWGKVWFVNAGNETGPAFGLDVPTDTFNGVVLAGHAAGRGPLLRRHHRHHVGGAGRDIHLR